MTHANVPLTPTGRLRVVLHHLDDGLPQAHAAAEFRGSRPTVARWVTRYRAVGEAGLLDRSSRPRPPPRSSSVSKPSADRRNGSPGESTSNCTR